MKVNAEIAAASQAMMVSSDLVARVDKRDAQRHTPQSKQEQARQPDHHVHDEPHFAGTTTFHTGAGATVSQPVSSGLLKV
jgi:hypothetical protein